MASYFTISVIALLGAVGGPWYLLLVGAAVLALLAVRDRRQYRPHFESLGISAALETAAHASAAYALLASLAAYGLGVFARLLFL
jgi:hypothetical protein